MKRATKEHLAKMVRKKYYRNIKSLELIKIFCCFFLNFHVKFVLYFFLHYLFMIWKALLLMNGVFSCHENLGYLFNLSTYVGEYTCEYIRGFFLLIDFIF